MSYNEGQFDYHERYGQPSNKAWAVYALILVITGFAWIIWAGSHHANPEISSELISFTTDNPRNPEIRYSIQRASGDDEVICTLVARDFEKNVVGQIDQIIPAGETNLELRMTVPTRADAVNVGVENCRINKR